MRIHNIYADENGETHFRDIQIELSEAGPDGTTSKRFPATGVIFRATPADWFFDWHPATRRQYVINLAGVAEFETADGAKRRLYPGDILVAEDLTGHGHIARSIGEEFRVSLAIPLADQ